jgi:hypothetical protein
LELRNVALRFAMSKMSRAGFVKAKAGPSSSREFIPARKQIRDGSITDLQI